MTIRYAVHLFGVTLSCLLIAGCHSVERGSDLFDMHCADCHTLDHPNLRKQPPKLNGIFQSGTLPSGTPATDEQLRNVIIHGLGTMPAFDGRLSQDDVSEIIKYLHTLK